MTDTVDLRWSAGGRSYEETNGFGSRNLSDNFGESPQYSSGQLNAEHAPWSEAFCEASLIPPEPQSVADLATWSGPSCTNAMLPLFDLKKRGRKPNRPYDPIHKKTEEKDKYWLRAFRAYMKIQFLKIRKSMSAEERFFWRDYLGPEGKPEKGNRYSSFGRRYKNSLFSSEFFVKHFQAWFLVSGETELLKKYPKHSPLWFVFYDYATKELFHYNPNDRSPQQDSEIASQATQASPGPLPSHSFGIAAADDEAQRDVEMLLEEL